MEEKKIQQKKTFFYKEILYCILKKKKNLHKQIFYKKNIIKNLFIHTRFFLALLNKVFSLNNILSEKVFW